MSTIGVGFTVGDEYVECIDGEEVTSGENFCGDVGGVAT